MPAAEWEVRLGSLWHFFLGSGKRVFVLWAVGASGVTFVVMRAWFPSALDRLVKLAQVRRLWVPLCVLFLAAYLVVLIGSTTYVGYLGHVEPHIASVSFILLRGAPLYHELASPQRYSLFYGPMAYLPYTLALRVLGANVFSLKLVVLFANLVLLGLLWRCYRQLLSPPETLLVVAVVIGCLLTSGTYDFQVRGDILLVLSVAVGLSAVLGSSTWVSILFLALACALSCDIKLTGLFYFLPLYFLFIRRHGWRPAALAGIGTAVFAVIPFLFPQISAVGYLTWLHQASRHPLVRVEAWAELKQLLIVCAPLGLLLWELAKKTRNSLATFLDKNRMFLVVLGGCLTAVAISASKIGAGPHHFMPFYPIAGFVCADIYREIRGVTAPISVPPRLSFIPLLWFWVVAALAAQIATGFSDTASTVLTSGSRSVAADITKDLERVMLSHTGKRIEMGYGQWNSYELTYFRPMLVFAGNPFTIDAVPLNDMQLSGIEIPRSTLDYLQGCKTQIWLIPKGDQPFVLVNVFSLIDPRAFPERPLFSDEFRRIFMQQYRKQSPSKYFDIWECNAESGLHANLKADSAAKSARYLEMR